MQKCPFKHVDEDHPISLLTKPDGNGFAVECSYCLAKGPWGSTKNEATEFWNKRNIPQNNQDKIKNLSETLRKYADIFSDLENPEAAVEQSSNLIQEIENFQGLFT